MKQLLNNKYSHMNYKKAISHILKANKFNNVTDVMYIGTVKATQDSISRLSNRQLKKTEIVLDNNYDIRHDDVINVYSILQNNVKYILIILEPLELFSVTQVINVIKDEE